MKRKFSFVLIAALILVLASGCTPSEPAGQGEETPQKDTLIVATSAEPRSLDAHGSNDGDSTLFQHLIYDTLFRQTADGEVAPGVVEDWNYIDDTTLTLKIREGVKFHNGEALDANDILFNLERALDSSYTNWMVTSLDLDNTKVIDEHTVEVKLVEPNGALLSQLCFLYVVDEDTVTNAGDDYENHPVGTGPFAFKEWFRGDRIEFETNKDYWGTIPEFDNLVLRIIPEPSSRAIEIESGGVDVALKIAATDVGGLEALDDVTMVRSLGFSNSFIGFNCSREPFTDTRVRQAISYALDRNAIVKAVWGEVGSVATGPISPTVWGYNPSLEGYEHDPNKAKDLLAEAGFGDGLEITLTTSDSKERMDISEIVQNQLGKVGITVKVESLENATYLDRIVDGTFEMYILGWTTVTGDADYGLYEPFYTGGPGWANTARYSNPEVDVLLDVGKVSTDDETRLEAYYEAQELLVDDAPWVFLYNSETLACVRSNVKGLVPSRSGRYEFNTITFK